MSQQYNVWLDHEVVVRMRQGAEVRGRLFCALEKQLIILSGDTIDVAHVLDPSHVSSISTAPSQGTVSQFTRRNFKFQKANDNDKEEITRPLDVEAHFWNRRYFLFSKFDQGIRLDTESWFSVTPEPVAEYIARRCRCDIILDACCGAGGNSIQFASTCMQVIACDVVPARIFDARHNAQIYGMEDSIEFVLTDAMYFMQSLSENSVDVVFLSPPWGGPEYRNADLFSVAENVKVYSANGTICNGVDLFREARRVARYGVAYFLPRTCTIGTLIDELGEAPREVEQHFLWSKSFTICAYFGDFV